jgi:hypothetical protein
LAFGVGVITGGVRRGGNPRRRSIVTDETLERWDSSAVSAGDVVIGSTPATRSGHEIGRRHACGAYVVRGIHATLYPEKPPSSAKRIRSSG